MLIVTKNDNGYNIEVDTQSEVASRTDNYRKYFYKIYGKHDDTEIISHNHRKVPTI